MSVQITIDGSLASTLPKSLFVFGLPLIFVVVNLVKKLSLARKIDVSTYGFYIIPVMAILL